MTHHQTMPPVPSCLELLLPAPRWCLWRWEERVNKKTGEVKQTKPPFNPNQPGRYAKNDTPSTWATFDKAAPLAKDGAGLGFMLMGEKRVRALDLDDCRNPETGALAPWAKDLVDRAGSYTEVTPSGKGVRILGRGPEDATEVHKVLQTEDGGHVEVYRQATRFITMSFNRVPGTPDTLAELDPVIDYVFERYGTKLQGEGLDFDSGHQEEDAAPSRVAEEDLPSWLAEKLNSPGDGDRSAHQYGVICALVEAGWSDEEIRASAEARPWGDRYRDTGNMPHDLKAARKQTRPMPEHKKFKVRGKTRRQRRTEAGVEADLAGFDETEDGIALAFAAKHKDALRYCHHTGAWFAWTGQRWEREETKLAFCWAREMCRDLNATKDAKLAKASTAGAVERFAAADRAFAVTSKIWDADPFLLGTPTGTVDLRTGELRAPHRNDFITRQTAVGPAPRGTPHPLWSRFLTEATAGDVDLQRFLQQMAGYCLTGDTREHALFFVHGGGGNGKGVFLNTVAGIMADYATTAGMDTFTASKHDRHPTDLAMLKGARLVSASETEEGRAWAESRIKQMTGGDPITARFMRQDFFTFQPAFKLLIIGNHRPVLRNVDDAARRRFNIVPFTHKPAKPDRQLESKLRQEWPAILRWAIEGCLDWQRNGLVRPAIVTEATKDYFDEQDTFHQWLEEDCDVEPGNRHKWETVSSLFASWRTYAERNGETAGTSKSFNSQMMKHGLVSTRKTVEGKTQRVFVGVQLPITHREGAADGW